jgi:TonB C terminal
MDLDLVRCAVRVAAALLLLASACISETTAPVPTALTPTPAVVLIQAPAATSIPASIAVPTSEPAAPTPPPAVVVIQAPVTTSARAPVAVPTSELAGAASTPDPRPLRPIRFERWRPAIENYAPVVQRDNTTLLDGARVPFATYFVAMHNRIHPIFAEESLGALGNLPKGHPLNQNLSTDLEIVLNKDTGKVVRMGVIRSSGMTVFDLVALTAVDRASPFGKAPDVIASPDGNVYIHWEFHRDPVDACTTRNARPFILKSAPSAP